MWWRRSLYGYRSVDDGPRNFFGRQRLYELLDGFVKVLLEAPEELCVMWAIPLHVSLQIELGSSLLVDIVVTGEDVVASLFEVPQLVDLAVVE